ncbi:signal recognition particle protein Srp54 [Aeropyrum camini]|uniref:Signal recognition particle 54 kDa protein n=1 Tax=Aeropyrum camini SY1 = JCM 12091 TaxID=1198449 RepID=U3TGU4_9CREN|nr:signal recognition particle protein Srp54 [Aeropyrum camini]BAN90559.1 signal recognition 54 kDa protein [Aeropyrum camini SY1 = JCM 12091]
MMEGVRRAVAKFLKGGGVYEKAVDAFLRDLQRELIKADVNVKLVLSVTRSIRERALKEEPPPGVTRRDWMIKIVYEELVKLFGGEQEPQVEPPKTPWVILLVGVQGSGKTTTAGKLAYYYVRRGYKVGLVSSDTHRPGAYEQLKRLAEEAGAMFYGEKEGDPADIARRGLEELLQRGAEVVIVDTAGRHGHGEEAKLLEEMRAIASKVRPDEVALVIDASIGQKAMSLAERFHKSTPIGSIIITKMDGTARGGGALTAAAVTGARIKFIGTGETLSELEPFAPRRFVARILGMGDLESLLERIRSLEEASELDKAAEDVLKGRITMRTIYRQLKAMRKLGPLGKVLQMLPGASMLASIDEGALKLGEEKMRRWMAIIESMTYEELDRPDIIDKRRMRRIAIGSGTSVEDVRELLTYYKNLKTMMKKLKRDKRLLRRLGMEI